MNMTGKTEEGWSILASQAPMEYFRGSAKLPDFSISHFRRLHLPLCQLRRPSLEAQSSVSVTLQSVHLTVILVFIAYDQQWGKSFSLIDCEDTVQI